MDIAGASQGLGDSVVRSAAVATWLDASAEKPNF
jgi:hypothetical protein